MEFFVDTVDIAFFQISNYFYYSAQINILIRSVIGDKSVFTVSGLAFVISESTGQ